MNQNQTQVLEMIRNYYIHRQELTSSNGKDFKDVRIVVSKSIRNDSLYRLSRYSNYSKFKLQ